MEQININLTINDGFTHPNSRIDDEFIATGLTVNQRVYVEVKQFCRIHKLSDSKVRRLLKKVEHKGSRDYFIKLEHKIFVSPSIIMLTKENYSKIDTLHGSWEALLRKFDWDFFGCVNFEWNMAQKTVKERMANFFDKLSSKYKDAEIRLFYVCEKNKDRDGYHTHFILWSDIADKSSVKSYIENHFRGNGKKPFANTKIERYDPSEGGIGYL